MRRLVLGLSLVLLLCAAAPALAQQGTAQVGGKITDAQGGALPGVTIVITNEDTGVVREITSTAEGSYFASQMVPGRYRISAKLEGFKALDRRGITLTVGQTTTLDLHDGSRRPRRDAHRHRRSAAGRRHDRRGRRSHLGGRAQRAAVGQPQLHGVCRQRARHGVHPERRVPERQLPGQRSADRGQQHRVRRREQHRRAARIERRRSDPRVERIDSGSADSHEPVRRRMGTRVGRRHQRGHQVGHESVYRAPPSTSIRARR